MVAFEEVRCQSHGLRFQHGLATRSDERDETTFPTDGVPFSLVLTIEDPSGQKPIFQTFRRYLQVRGTQIDDIRTALRLRQRR